MYLCGTIQSVSVFKCKNHYLESTNRKNREIESENREFGSQNRYFEKKEKKKKKHHDGSKNRKFERKIVNLKVKTYIIH